ncbi:Long-chain-fatty-acid--CoA ligase [Amycolatopsis sp. CA-230715]|nr:Long-chain-fatty-acid--CoA ligase [Amycolatopsis sp. CA-230715]
MRMSGSKRGAAVGKIGASPLGMSVLVTNGLVKPMSPAKLLRIRDLYRKFGLTVTFAVGAEAVRHPARPAVIDDFGTMTYQELDESSTRLANGLRRICPAHGLLKIGLLAKNHRAAVQTCLAAGKLGADLVVLNTGLAEKQMRAVVEEQRIDILVVDDDLLHVLEGFPRSMPTVLHRPAGYEAPDTGVPRPRTLDSLIRRSPASPLPTPSRGGRTILLTSGTTGTPKGVVRPDPAGLAPIAELLNLLPLRAGTTMMLASPFFHVLGFSLLQLAMMLGDTVVLHREFDAARTVAAIGRHNCASLVGSPIMLRRLTEVPAADRERIDTGSLRIALAGGSALPGKLVPRFTEAFGPVLYNIYGSAELSWATVATPRDLAEDENTAGTPPRGTRVAILDASGKPSAPGQIGRIFVGNEMLFDGYTRRGEENEYRDGALYSGDLGYLDTHGKLFVSGREEDVVVTGGEKTYPVEVENLLCAREDIAEAAVIGVPDDHDGQRLCAYVVPEPGSEVSPEEVRTWVAANLARFSVPRDIVIVDNLPRNPAGKILYRELRARPSTSGTSRWRAYQRLASGG